MSFAAQPRRPAPAGGGPRRRPSPLAITIAAVVALAVVVFLLAQLWTEVLWYRQLGFSEVIWTEWGTRAALFAGAFVLMAGLVYLNLRLAHRNRPIYAPSTPEQATLDQYREAIEPLRRLVMVAAPALLGVFAGVAASSQWTTVLLWLNSVPFGTTDPEYGIDLSFYMFSLPALRFVVSFVMAVVVISGIAALATHYLYGGLQVGGSAQGVRTTHAARIQLAVLAAALMVLIGVNYWLDRYSILKTDGERFAGASFADVNAVIPAKAILAGVAVLVAALFVVTAIRGNWRLPAIGVGLMVVAAIVVGGVYPAVVQRFQVTPNAQQLEAEFIQRNIDATRTAFGLDDTEVQAYNAKTTAEAGALREDAQTTASIRLLDPTIVSPSFRQLQQNRGYYNFSDTLSVDRYEIEGESRDTLIAVRELNLAGLGDDQRNWVNDHTVYTHGYGVVAAYGNQIGPDGRPAFYEGGIPSVGNLSDLSEDGYEPRIYFSPNSPSYSVVGAPDGTDPWELDYPTDEAEGGQVNTTFPTESVEIGPSVGNLANKLLYALKFQSEEILFSDRVTDASQIVYDRDPRERVEKVAPYLTLDGRVYPAVVDGRVKWIVDGYTTSNEYPYSASESLEDATADSLTATSASIQALQPQEVNYIRNSVKATVDAYDGSVTLYAWDTEDPVLKAWQGVFPNSIEPLSEISADLMSHIRYPEDIFKVQRTLLTQYHVDTASEFFSGQDFWRNPEDPTAEGDNKPLQPPYYLTLQMPGQEQPAFSLSSSFITGGTGDRNVLTGYLAVNAEAGDEAGQPAEDYGKLRLLELPRGSTVPGPGQVQNNFNSDNDIAQNLNLLRQGNSTVLNGNLLTVPVGGGLLYVQPVYVQSSSGTQFPLLRKVLVAFGDEVGFADTLDEALDQVFAGDSGATAGDADAPDEGEVPVDEVPTDEAPTDEPTDAPTEDPTTEPTDTPDAPAGDPRARLDSALTDAGQALQDSQDALADGDFAGYGEAQDRLQVAIEEALAAEEELG
ncbi:UPF0182 family membrane protein [Sanguibacter suaedae]|uniref:UPF0182 protein JAV76_13875 n=1 Tax=Sanguibacter suaedae TaxID=2795737 RepID=A0A934IAJ2_9MICO|nr:UPF0182 family protein [Sanguibacter suaedae]MBI9116102.1 UPF0182 family protein [Sanguibacter suaedae]